MKLIKQAGSVAAITSLLFGVVATPVWAAPRDMAAMNMAMGTVSASAPAVAEAPLSMSSGGGSMTTMSATGQGMGKPVDTTAPVDTKIKKDDAEKIARDKFQIQDDYKLQSVYLNSSFPKMNSNGTWQLTFQKEMKSKMFANINVIVNATTGQVTSYSIYNPDPSEKPSYPPKTDYEQAKQLANDWLAKYNPELQKDVRILENSERDNLPLTGDVSYNFTYERIVNGIPFPQNQISIYVNGDGKVTSYNFNWDAEQKFAETTTTINADQAAKAFAEKVKFQLSYTLIPNSSGKQQPLITYNINQLISIDAKSGNVFPNIFSAESIGKPLADKPLAEPPAANQNLTKEQAVARVMSIFKLPDTAILNNADYNEYTNADDGKTRSNWNLGWSLTQTSEGKNDIWVSVNSQTGEIINYNNYHVFNMQESKNAQPKLSFNDSKEKAIAFVKNLLPYYAHQLVLEPTKQPSEKRMLPEGNLYSFNFPQIIDDVRAGYNNVSVTIDPVSGEINNYYNNLSNMDYPQKRPEVIASDKAMALLFSQYDIRLVYLATDDSMYNDLSMEKYQPMSLTSGLIMPMPDNSSKEPIIAQLYYQLTPKYNNRDPIILDATSGQWRNTSTGEVTTLEKQKATDITGHWAQKELQLMLDYHSLDLKDGKINPDQAITRGEFIKMVMIAMNNGNVIYGYAKDRANSFADVQNASKYFSYVEMALDQNLITRTMDTFQPEDPITREEVAQLIVRALGYQKLSEQKQLFTQGFTDEAAIKQPGQAALVVGLKIMSPASDNSFQPLQNMTRAEAAAAFYSFLQQRENLREVRGMGMY